MSHLICLASDTPLVPDKWEPCQRPTVTVTVNGKTFTVTAPEDCRGIWPIGCADHLQSKLPYLAEVEWPCSTPDRAALLADYIRRHLELAEEVELWNLWDGSDVELVRVHREEISLSDLTTDRITALCEKDALHPIRLGPVEEWQQFCLQITK